MSIHSQLTSSLMETSEAEKSEDERKRKKEEERRKRKGFSEAELNQYIDVELTETKTMTLMVIRSVVVNQDTQEHADAQEANKVYDQLV